MKYDLLYFALEINSSESCWVLIKIRSFGHFCGVVIGEKFDVYFCFG